MRKKLISLLLTGALMTSVAAIAVPANAATAEKDSAVGTVSSADDFSWDNANVYFLLTDRFYNGNTSNDHSYGRTLDANGSPISGWNTSPGTFHGGDFAGVTKKLNEGYFDKLGTNAIWISAPYEQIHGYVTPGEPNDFAHYSYHGYYVLDYTETDANFGTKEEFKTMVDTAHEHGIRIIMDIVMNHAGYNTIADMEEFNFGTFKDQSAAHAYRYKITGVNNLHSTINYDASADDWGRWWGNDWVRSGLPGYTMGGGGDLEMCLTGLPDFRTEQTKNVSIPTFLQTKWKNEGTYNNKISKYGSSASVSDYISTWLAEWVETYGVDGFRCDTAKHVEFASWKKLKTKCVEALKKWRANNPNAVGANWDEDFWMTGECWGHGLGKSGYYTEGGFDSMINFSFSGVGVPAISSIDGVYQNYASTINNDPSFNALTYISSHDSNLARGDLLYQGSALQLMPGGIQVYYGDETNRPLVSGIPFDGNGDSGHSLRSDMNWSNADSALLSHWQKVGQFRNRHVAVGAGSHNTISSYSGSTGLTFSRSYDDGETADSIIATIGAPANTTLSIDVSSIWSDGVTVTNYYDGKTAVVANGKASFNTGANGTILIEGPQSSINMSVKGDYSFYDSETVTVSLRGADYAMVKIDGGKAFKVVNGDTFSIGDGIEVGTVFKVEMTASNSEETITKLFSFKKKDPNAVTKVYFDNTSYGWSQVYAYVYVENSTGSAESNAKWPGELMSYDNATGLYVYEIPDGLENGLIIFTESSSTSNRYPADNEKGLAINDTNMIFLEGNQWKAYDGQKADPTTAPDSSTTKTVYYDASNTGFGNPYIYAWSNSTKDNNGTWPGKPMTKVSGNIWKATFSNQLDMCIFTNQGSNKTSDLSIPGTNYVYDGTAWKEYEVKESTQPTTQPLGTIIIGDATQDSMIKIDDATLIQKHLASLANLSGNGVTAADVDQDGIISVKDATSIQFYLADNFNHSGSCGKIIGKVDPDPTTQPTTSTQPVDENVVYFKNTNNWGSVNVYFWSDTNTTMMTWPGNAATAVGNNVYKAEIPSGATWVIFNCGSAKTDDLKLQSGKMYENGSWVSYSGGSDDPSKTNPTLSSRKVYFDASNRGWSSVNAYFWSDANTKMMTWPGAAMSNDGNGIFSCDIPDGATLVIFNCNGSQTDDLTLVAGKTYN